MDYKEYFDKRAEKSESYRKLRETKKYALTVRISKNLAQLLEKARIFTKRNKSQIVMAALEEYMVELEFWKEADQRYKKEESTTYAEFKQKQSDRYIPNKKHLTLIGLLIQKAATEKWALAKQMFFAELLYYCKTGRRLTGLKYFKTERGALPHQYDDILGLQISMKNIFEDKIEGALHYTYWYRLNVNYRPRTDVFGKTQMECINATSKYSHIALSPFYKEGPTEEIWHSIGWNTEIDFEKYRKCKGFMANLKKEGLI